MTTHDAGKEIRTPVTRGDLRTATLNGLRRVRSTPKHVRLTKGQAAYILSQRKGS